MEAEKNRPEVVGAHVSLEQIARWSTGEPINVEHERHLESCDDCKQLLEHAGDFDVQRGAARLLATLDTDRRKPRNQIVAIAAAASVLLATGTWAAWSSNQNRGRELQLADAQVSSLESENAVLAADSAALRQEVQVARADVERIQVALAKINVRGSELLAIQEEVTGLQKRLAGVERAPSQVAGLAVFESEGQVVFIGPNGKEKISVTPETKDPCDDESIKAWAKNVQHVSDPSDRRVMIKMDPDASINTWVKTICASQASANHDYFIVSGGSSGNF